MEDGYRLTYKCGNYFAEVKFGDEIDLDDLTANLESFLLACTWLPKQVRQILKRID